MRSPRTDAWALAALLLVAALAPLAQAPQTLTASEPVTATALAVARSSQGLTGVSANVHATVLANGTGEVFVSTKPLAQTDMQGSARLAARVAAQTLGYDWQDYDYFIVFESDSVVIGGPSAGSVMTLATTIALHNLERPEDPWELDPRVAMTGTINPDGTVGPVGGIPTKADAAARAGMDLVLFPAGQERVARLHSDGTQGDPVNVPAYCRDHLGITCRSVATIGQALPLATGVALNRTSRGTPSTADYADILGPRVEPDVARLASRLPAARSDLETADLSGSQEQNVRDSLSTAEERLDRARSALDQGRYYTGITMAFQGSISVGHAENLTELYRSDGSAEVVQEAIATCQRAVDDARDLAYPLNASGMQELYAVGAAQRRVVQAQGLLESATQGLREGTTLQAWSNALFDASFCTERAGTVAWWADLRHAFGPGPPVRARDLAQEVLALARERVAYARAVLPAGADLSQAEDRLSTARTALSEGRAEQAVIMGIEAQVEASVAVQVGGGGSVPGAVLEAAREAASEAIAGARTSGVEPMVSVALVELSQDVDSNRSALNFLWTSRSLAGLSPDPDPKPVGYTFVGRPRDLTRSPLSQQELVVGVVTGLLAGGLVVGLVATTVRIRD